MKNRDGIVFGEINLVLTRSCCSSSLNSRLICAVILAALTGCSGSSTTPEPEAVEVKLSDAELRDAPEGVLFNEARRLYKAGLYSVSVESFDSLRLNYPNSPYAEFSEIKAADSYFETKEFATAANLYEEFVKNHPVSPNVPYTLLRAARSHQLLNRGVGRDVAPLKKALELYERLIVAHPGSVYAREAELRKSEVRSQIAAHEQFVMAFYKKQNKVKALKAREEKFEREWAGKVLAPLPDSEVAQPNTPLLVKTTAPAAPKIMAVQSASETMRARFAPPRSNKTPTTQVQEGPGLRLQRVACTTNAVFVYLDKPIEDPAFAAAFKLTEPKDGQLTIMVPGGFSKDAAIDCRGEKDLTLSTSGELRLASNKPAQVMTLQNPPRILISF